MHFSALIRIIFELLMPRRESESGKVNHYGLSVLTWKRKMHFSAFIRIIFELPTPYPSTHVVAVLSQQVCCSLGCLFLCNSTYYTVPAWWFGRAAEDFATPWNANALHFMSIPCIYPIKYLEFVEFIDLSIRTFAYRVWYTCITNEHCGCA